MKEVDNDGQKYCPLEFRGKKGESGVLVAISSILER